MANFDTFPYLARLNKQYALKRFRLPIPFTRVLMVHSFWSVLDWWKRSYLENDHSCSFLAPCSKASGAEFPAGRWVEADPSDQRPLPASSSGGGRKPSSTQGIHIALDWRLMDSLCSVPCSQRFPWNLLGGRGWGSGGLQKWNRLWDDIIIKTSAQKDRRRMVCSV